jgi:hypothetical protein
MNGYDEAAKVDAVLNGILDDNGVTEENALEWLKVTRTVQSSLNILEERAKDKADLATKRRAGWVT